MSKKQYPDFWKNYSASFKKPISKKLSEVNFVVLDTETTGFKKYKDRILCIGALKLKNHQIEVKDCLEVYINQDYYDPVTAEIHGILQNTKRETVDELEALKQFLDFAQNAVLVAHHAFFDINMINVALHRNGLGSLKNKVIDTSHLYYKSLATIERKNKGKQFTLDELADSFEIDKKDRHTALGDAYITAIAFLRIVDRLKPKRLKELFPKKWLF